MRNKVLFDWWLNSGQSFNPVQLNPVLWIDAINGPYVTNVDNNTGRGKIVNSATAMTGQALTNAGTLASKAIWNGEGWWMKNGAEFNTGLVSTYNFLHNGSDFHVFIVYKKLVSTGIRALINTNGFSNTAVGMLVYDDAGALKGRIGNGSASPFSRDSVAGTLVAGNTYLIELQKTGSTIVMRVNGTQVATQTVSLSFSSADAAQVMDICSTTAATATVYLKDLVIFNRSLSVDEAALMRARTFTSIVPTSINVDLFRGDSNTDGQVPNVNLPAELTGPHDTLIFKMATAAVAASDYIERLQLGVNHKILNTTLTLSGGEMRYGYLFRDPNLTRAILKFGMGSSQDADWTTPALTYTRWLAMIPRFVEELYHAHRRTVTVRTLISWYGANNCQAGEGGTYESTDIALTKATIDAFNALTAQYGTVVKMRQIIFRTRNTGTSFDPTATALVRTAQANIAAGAFLVAHPSYSTYYAGATIFDTDGATMLPGDDIHYGTYEVMSPQAYNYAAPFSNE